MYTGRERYIRKAFTLVREYLVSVNVYVCVCVVCTCVYVCVYACVCNKLHAMSACMSENVSVLM